VGFLQDSPPASTAYNTMPLPITIDNSDIQKALNDFGIDKDSYYILFESNCIYIVWCTKGNNALGLIENYDTISIDIKGEWFYIEELPPGFKPDPLVCVRYILATN
jgi:hypothetical protein